MSTLKTTLPVESGFRLGAVVRSHGWYDLPPFSWNDSEQVLTTAGWIAGQPCEIAIMQTDAVTLQLVAIRAGRWTAAAEQAVPQTVRRILGLEVMIDDFYRIAGQGYAWARKRGLGRLLRSPSVYEDAVKMLATTNCSWAMTRKMTQALVEHLGSPTPTGRKTFPTPAAMVAQSPDYFRNTVRAGYRGVAMHRLAHAVVSGTLAIDQWDAFEGPTEALLRQIRAQHGFGPYAAENLCKLFGRFDGLALDSWCRNKFSQLTGITENVDAAIRQRYAKYGQWQGLALWLDLTRDWHGAQVDRFPPESATVTPARRQRKGK